MKRFKLKIIIFSLMFLSIVSCDQNNIVIDVVIPPEPIETSSNALINRGEATEGGYDMGCFIILFSFQVTINGDTLEIDNEEDFVLILLDSLPYPNADFIYPISIKLIEDNSIQTINNGEELGILFANCIPSEGWENGFPAFLFDEDNSCYNLKYPIRLIDNQNQILIAYDEIEFINFIAEKPFLLFDFPLQIRRVDSENIISIETQEILFDSLVSCNINSVPDSFYTTDFDSLIYACYTIGFPLNYLNQDNEIVSASDINELNSALISGNFIDLAFPIILIDIDGNITTVQSEEQLENAILACDVQHLDFELWTLWENYNSIHCYDLIYPINVTYSIDSTIIALNNENDIIEELNNFTDAKIIYPLSVFSFSMDTTVLFNNSDEMMDFIFNCE